MAYPTAAQCKLLLSFDMVAKTMTASVQNVISAGGIDGLVYNIYYGTLVDPLGDSVDIDEITYDGDGGQGSQVFDAPLDSDGNVLNGTYSILLPYVVLDGEVSPQTYDDVNSSYTLDYTAPIICITQTIDCITPKFTSQDITSVKVIDPTDQTSITPTVSNYAHNLSYPVGSDGGDGYATPTDTDDKIIIRGDGEFFQGTQTSYVKYDLSYTFVDLLVVTDTVQGTKEIKVNCSGLLCSITCGINKLYNRMLRTQVSNSTQYQLQYQLYLKLNADLMLARQNISCGNSEQASAIQFQINKELGDCCCNDCDAKDGTPITRAAGW